MADDIQPSSARAETAPAEGSYLGRYRVVRSLGAGGMGEVYMGLDEDLGRNVAIKILAKRLADEPSNVARFRREARVCAKLLHPNITQIFEFNQHEGRPYFVMEYVEGGTLDELIRRSAPIAVERAVDMAIQISSGLAAAAKQNIIHRDVKPSNILVQTDGAVKITDFGLARLRDDNLHLTRTNIVLGTPHYISPEQARGDKAIDFRADVYSLGATLYHALSGRPPFDSQTPIGVMVQHINDPVPSLAVLCPSLPMEAVRLVHRMLEKKPGDRFQSYEALMEALQGVQSASERNAPPAQPATGAHETPGDAQREAPSPPTPPREGGPLVDTLKTKKVREEPAPSPAPEPEDLAEAELPLVLVVEESPTTRELMSMFVREAGLPCVGTGEALMTVGFLRHQKVRIVILDADLTEHDCLQVLAEIRAFEAESGCRVPTIVLTSSEDESLSVAALKAGAFYFLSKPFLPEVLADCLERACVLLEVTPW